MLNSITAVSVLGAAVRRARLHIHLAVNCHCTNEATPTCLQRLQVIHCEGEIALVEGLNTDAPLGTCVSFLDHARGCGPLTDHTGQDLCNC